MNLLGQELEHNVARDPSLQITGDACRQRRTPHAVGDVAASGHAKEGQLLAIKPDAFRKVRLSLGGKRRRQIHQLGAGLLQLVKVRQGRSVQGSDLGERVDKDDMALIHNDAPQASESSLPVEEGPEFVVADGLREGQHKGGVVGGVCWGTHSAQAMPMASQRRFMPAVRVAKIELSERSSLLRADRGFR